MSTEQKTGCSITLDTPADIGEQLQVLQVHSRDNVVVALQPLEQGVALPVPFAALNAQQAVPAGHKVALTDIAKGEPVIKYGFAIGAATKDIRAGEHIHSHNLATLLSGQVNYRFDGCQAQPLAFPDGLPREFMGYRRANGKVGTRNELWIINTVGCVNRAAMRVAEQARKLYGDEIDGIHAFTHPFGCSQLGDDLDHTRRLLAGLIQHPNAGAVLVMGLGCENNQLSKLLAASPGVDLSRIRSFNAQQVEDEIEQGLAAVEELIAQMRSDKRTPCPISDLVVGMKCGGSDGLSGLTANPLVGRMADLVAAGSGKVILTETPEMFGAEQVFMARAQNEQVFGDIVSLVNDFKQYFIDNKQPVYENPSPGNKDGGLTTLEEKSLGAIQKGGSAVVNQVIRYGDTASLNGLTLLEGPGNDAVSSTALTAAGATLLLFTTGRGTPLGFPAPTVKISSNSSLAARKPQWIDFDAGGLLKKDQNAEQFSYDFFRYLIDVASGKLTRNEVSDNREIAIWKNGVTL
ncbi:altronate dehydratase family protein [Rheinheimera baltica]|uniref:Altronate dehydratase family protein n=1 Tax=Rheinheimera baltica TaxID=67576 RepID=A0ABT9I2W6_9GAMM|nr:altronate dehydratase family protein [Rheinheimera baltica]MDP5137714.1 altronate dehydratase family protein [Rheinheimera baltica]MDP5150117.1 altronate dehydratase family protein [Rheinheimera baltica]